MSVISSLPLTYRGQRGELGRRRLSFQTSVRPRVQPLSFYKTCTAFSPTSYVMVTWWKKRLKDHTLFLKRNILGVLEQGRLISQPQFLAILPISQVQNKKRNKQTTPKQKTPNQLKFHPLKTLCLGWKYVFWFNHWRATLFISFITFDIIIYFFHVCVPYFHINCNHLLSYKTWTCLIVNVLLRGETGFHSWSSSSN